MCELCGCAGRRDATDAVPEATPRGIPIRIPVVAVPFERDAAEAGAADGGPAEDRRRSDDVAERALEAPATGPG
jgi:hypothetical protein